MSALYAVDTAGHAARSSFDKAASILRIAAKLGLTGSGLRSLTFQRLKDVGCTSAISQTALMDAPTLAARRSQLAMSSVCSMSHA